MLGSWAPASLVMQNERLVGVGSMLADEFFLPAPKVYLYVDLPNCILIVDNV